MSTATINYKAVDGREITFEMELYTKDRLNELLERIRQGNKKLGEAWVQVAKLDHSTQEYKDSVDRWFQADVKLKSYCDQLEAMGFRNCLYMIDGKKTHSCLDKNFTCWVCPSAVEYWLMEFDDLGRSGKE